MDRLERAFTHTDNVVNRSIFFALLLVHLGCSSESAEYFPLSADRSWHYHLERTTMDGSFALKHIVENLPSISWQEQSAVPRATAGGEQYLYQQHDGAIERIAVKARTDTAFRVQSPPAVVLPRSLAPGTKWSGATYTTVLENTGPPWETLFRIAAPVEMHYEITTTTAEVGVPAGNFQRCLQLIGQGSAYVDVGNYIGRTRVTVEVKEWYAPGVGLVKSIRTETTGAEAISHGELVMELEYFSD